MKSIENKLTILLTLKGRESFTYRWLEYSNNIRLPFRIYIADGEKIMIYQRTFQIKVNILI